jgi:hypothetical protein
VTEVSNPINIMANKTYVVTLKEVPPYTMLKEEVRTSFQTKPFFIVSKMKTRCQFHQQLTSIFLMHNLDEQVFVHFRYSARRLKGSRITASPAY